MNTNPPALNQAIDWSPIQKISFRFLFVYLLLYIFPFPIDAIPGLGEWSYETAQKIWDPLVIGFADLFLNLEITIKPAGSGDTTYNYVQILLFISISLLVSVIWSALDRKRMDYEKIYAYLEIGIRYYLAITLISYGLAKVFKTQFPAPYYARLLQPIGDMSPMGLAWTFLGYSYGFNLFTGIGEALGGFLLFFRRTKVLGGFIGLSVMATIVAMNFCYDIPVKLFSSHLILMLVFVLWSDRQRIFNFLILNKSVMPANLSGPFQNKKVAKVFKALVILLVLGTQISQSIEGYKEYGPGAAEVPLAGIYEVEQFSVNRTKLPPLTSDSVRWENMVIQWPNFATIKLMNSKKKYLGFEPDTIKQSMYFYNRRDSINENATFDYTEIGTDSFSMEGLWSGDTISILMTRKKEEDFLLMKRGFHWINERPYNR